MRQIPSTPGARLIAAALAAALLACGGDATTEPEIDHLAGLTRVEQGDSVATAPPNAPTAPGRFHGTVWGYVPGGDTLATRVPLGGVRITAYRAVPRSDGGRAPGDEVASTTTAADGTWALPTLPGGEYVVTIVPPSGSGYRGIWATATAWAHSADHPWFTMLPKTG